MEKNEGATKTAEKNEEAKKADKQISTDKAHQSEQKDDKLKKSSGGCCGGH